MTKNLNVLHIKQEKPDKKKKKHDGITKYILQGGFGGLPAAVLVSQFRVLSDRNALRNPPRNMYSTVGSK
jgi:hypothetical protein